MKTLLLCVTLVLGSALAKPSSRVIGGTNATPNEFPYQISLQWNYNDIFRKPMHFCGASIITESWVLTAGHCNIQYTPRGHVDVVAGEHNLKVADKNEQRREVAKFIVHELYGGSVGPNDIAVIFLKKPFELNSIVQPIALPEQDFIASGDSIITGWGSTSTSAIPKYPNILQKAVLPIIDYEKCETFWPNSPLAESNVCAGALSGETSVCSGDSGGPLVKDIDGELTQIGVVSWGRIPCGSPQKPGIFVRVSHFVDWIAEQMDANQNSIKLLD